PCSSHAPPARSPLFPHDALPISKEPPRERVITLAAGNNKFVIPAGEANHEVESKFTLRSDATLTTLFPHMHLRGKDFEYRMTLRSEEHTSELQSLTNLVSLLLLD